MPEPWKAYSNEQEEIYYRNTITGQTIYDHPLDEVFRKKFQEAKAKKMGVQGGRAAAANSGQGVGFSNPGVFGAKEQDPLIQAETNQRVKEQSG